ncbi:MAG: hypothetical protein WC282_01015 [Bacilli bacterium]|jgi:DNA/RNA endonuclease YhcR with UshA esterase domain
MKKRLVLLPLLMLVLAACDPVTTDTSDVTSEDSTPTSETVTSEEPTSETSSEEVVVVSTVAEVRALAAEGEVVVEGNVLVKNLRGFVLGDATGMLLVYQNALPTVALGDFVRVTGTTTTYQGARQIGNQPAPVIVAGEGTNPNIVLPTADEMTSAEWDAFDMATSVPTFIAGVGEVFASGDFFNIHFYGVGEETAATLPGSLAYPDETMNFAVAANVGKSFSFEGVINGTSSSSGVKTRHNVMVTSFEEIVVEQWTSISAILAEATAGKSYTTRGVVTGVNGGSIFLSDPTDGAAINVYNSGTNVIKDTLVVGNVVEAIGSFKLYNLAPELDVASLTLISATSPTAVAPVVISDAATLATRTGTDYSLSGQLVRLNGVTTGPSGTPSTNNFVITLGTATVTGYAFFSLAHENATNGRTAINAAINALNTSGATFDIIGVLYSSNSTGVWKLGLCTSTYIIAAA